MTRAGVIAMSCLKKSGEIRLSDHFTYGRLLRFVLPSVCMMLFTSVYSVVDGFFVSNYVGKIPFAAVNLVMPLLTIFCSAGFMMGAGGNAIVGKTLGEGQRALANRYFSLFLYVICGVGTLLAVLGIVFARPLVLLLGAEGEMLGYCVRYARIILCALPMFMLQNMFQVFFITAEKPRLGLFVTVFSGVLNIVLDALLVAVFPLGLTGAAIATALAQMAGGTVALVYFARPNTGLLQICGIREAFARENRPGRMLAAACINGSSEMVSNIAMSVVSIVYNFQLMSYIGEDGIAAYGVIMYVGFLFVAIYIGYAMGVSPVVSFHFGAENRAELRNLRKLSMAVLAVTGVGMLVLSQSLAVPLSALYVGYDASLYSLTVHAFRIFNLSYLLCGFSIFISAFFTALNDGVTSAVISLLRTFVFQIASVLLLPLFCGIEGVWWSVIVSEGASVLLSFFCLLRGRRRFGY